LPVLILVICLAISVFLLLIVIVVCVVKKKNKESQRSAPDSPESQRPFNLPDQQAHLLQQQQLLQQYPGKMFHKPLPPTPFVAQKWTSSVYPKVPGQPLSTDSGLFTEHDSSKEMDVTGNQYEVPYAHLLPVGSTTSSNSSASSNNNRFLRSSCCFTSSGPNQVDGAMTSRSGPGSGFSSEQLSYNHDQRRKYFSDYDSQ